jgi:hypothetical protein
VGKRKNKGGNQKVTEVLMKMKHNLSEPMRHSKGSPKRKVYSHEYIY